MDGVIEQLVFKHKGRKCVILSHHGHFCAYAETKLLGMGYGELDDLSPDSIISCHGGLTFAGTLKDHKEWFFGMDFAHAGDVIPGMTAYPGDHAWTLEEVKAETVKLCEEVISYETDKELARLLKLHRDLKKEIEKYKASRE